MKILLPQGDEKSGCLIGYHGGDGVTGGEPGVLPIDEIGGVDASRNRGGHREISETDPLRGDLLPQPRGSLILGLPIVELIAHVMDAGFRLGEGQLGL